MGDRYQGGNRGRNDYNDRRDDYKRDRGGNGGGGGGGGNGDRNRYDDRRNDDRRRDDRYQDDRRRDDRYQDDRRRQDDRRDYRGGDREDRGGYGGGGHRGGDRGGYGGDRGGYGGGNRGGYGGGDRGGYGGGNRGGGGYGGGGGDRGGRGGYRGGGGGGGRGGGANYAGKDRENKVVSAVSNTPNLPKQNLEIMTNMVPLNTERAAYHEYIVHYEFGDNAIDQKGDEWKIVAQRTLLKKLLDSHPEYANVCKFAVCTGQCILLPQHIPDEKWEKDMPFVMKDKEHKKLIERHYKLSVRYVGEKKFDLSTNATMANVIIGRAITEVYANHVGAAYIDVNKYKEHNDDIITMEAIVPKAMRVKLHNEEVDVLQVDVRYAVSTSKRLNCLNQLEDLRRKNKSENDFMREASKMLKGKKVATFYAKGKNVVLKVKDICFDLTVNSDAQLKKSPGMTFVEYFKQKYNQNLQPNGMIVLCKMVGNQSGRPIKYPAELLHPMVLNEQQKRSLPMICSIYPEERLAMVKSAINRLNDSKEVKEFLDAYHITISANLLPSHGNILPAPTIYVPGRNGYSKIDPNLPDYTRPQGFAFALKSLNHPAPGLSTGTKPQYTTLEADEFTQRATPLWSSLRQYNIALPDPQFRRFGNPHQVQLTGRAGSTFRLVKLDERNRDVDKIYNEYKSNFAQQGVISQMVRKQLDKNIPQMVAQQMAAKIGQLNYVIDASEVAPSLRNKPVIVIGADVGSSSFEDKKGGKNLEKSVFTVTFVAFCVEGKNWKPYCNHYQVSGRERVLFSDPQGDSVSASGASEVSGREVPSEVLNEKMKDFIKDVRDYFKPHEPGTVVVFRGCPSEGEIAITENYEGVIKSILPQWRYAVITAQGRSHTRFAWNVSKSLPSAGVKELCNPPRGFCTEECGDSALGIYEDGKRVRSFETFYITGASCTLGHASNTFYAVLARSKELPLRELESLIFAMCFMYPNKPDALPLPLPMKCAAEYARKFGKLPSVKKLHPDLRGTMHYLEEDKRSAS